MSNLKLDMPRPYSYADVERFTTEASRKVGHNTTIHDMSHGIYEVCYHRHPIIHYATYGVSITLAGWDTLTTRDRLHRLTPISVGKVNGKTYGGATRLDDVSWYQYPWPDNPDADTVALAEWGRTVEAVSRLVPCRDY